MKRALMLVLAIALLCSGDAVAGVNFDIGVLWSPDASDDTQVYMHASNIAYPIRRQRVEAVYYDIPRPELDYPVLAFIAYESRVDIRTVWAYRAQGHEWFDCMAHFRLQPDVLFASVPASPGPPYGKAYGYWKKRGNRITPRQVNDDDVRYWVGLRSVSKFTGTPIGSVFEALQRGEKIRRVAGSYHREQVRKANSKGKKSQGGNSQGGNSQGERGENSQGKKSQGQGKKNGKEGK